MSNKSDVVVKLVLVFFVSLLSFSIGTYVGRKYSDNQHKMAQLEPNKIEAEAHTTREVASENSEATPKTKTNESLTDDEIAKLAEEFVADDGLTKEIKAETTHGVAASDEHKEKAAAEHTTPSAIAAAVVEGKTPVAKAHIEEPKAKAESRIPSSIPKDVAQYAVGKYTVQIASFSAQSEAETKSTELQNKGYKAFIVPALIKGKNWYRVSVGLFASEKEAKEYRTDFLAKTKVESALVQKISN